MKAPRSLKLFHVVSEVDPLAKTGGLADVAAALPRALSALGHDVRLAIPLYRAINRKAGGFRLLKAAVSVSMAGRILDGRLWQGVLPGTPIIVYGIEQPALFDRDGLYQSREGDFADNLARFSFFSQAALQLLPQAGLRPDVVHCHDWQAALCAAQLKFGAFAAEPAFSGVASVLTIHNLAYQGVFPKTQWPVTGLPDAFFSMQGLEFYDQINCLKGGLVSAGRITTVSPTYAREIQTPEFGWGLDGLLRQRSADLTGILNGIDTELWNPATDKHIAANYTAQRLSGKAACKRALQQRLGLAAQEGLLIGMVQRLVDQKGIDIVLEAAESLMRLPLQLAVLGTGEARYHRALQALAARFPGRVAVSLTFDESLAHQIEAGADAFLMASRFEPCGLNQMYSLRYGTAPIVKRVGGLADTVIDREDPANPPTGFVFDEHTAPALVNAVRRALAAFQDRAAWLKLMRNGMQQDFSWKHSAQAYLQVYEAALAAVGPASRAASPAPGRTLRRQPRGRAR